MPPLSSVGSTFEPETWLIGATARKPGRGGNSNAAHTASVECTSALPGRHAPLELEIGPGNGEYLAAMAAERSAHDFLAVELLWGRVKKCLRKLGGARLTNARLVCGNIGPVLAYLVPPRSLHAVHTLFPCPWPGDAAGAHRLYRADFLRLVNSRLVDGGRVTLVTDNRPYFCLLYTSPSPRD